MRRLTSRTAPTPETRFGAEPHHATDPAVAEEIATLAAAVPMTLDEVPEAQVVDPPPPAVNQGDLRLPFDASAAIVNVEGRTNDRSYADGFIITADVTGVTIAKGPRDGAPRVRNRAFLFKALTEDASDLLITVTSLAAEPPSDAPVEETQGDNIQNTDSPSIEAKEDTNE